MPEHLRLTINENLDLHALFFAQSSPKRSLPIILICGLGVSSSYMTRAGLELAKNADVYCPDLPGFGKSSKPAQTLDVSELAQALSAFIRKARIERAVFIGHSFGCQILAEYALQNEDQIECLIFAAPMGDPDINFGWRYLGRLMMDSVREPFSLIRLAVKDYLSAGLMRVLKTFRFALADKIEEKLPRIKAPTLIVRGTKDPIVTFDWASRAAATLPFGTLASIEDAAHGVNYSSPDEFARMTEEFIQDNQMNERDLARD